MIAWSSSAYHNISSPLQHSEPPQATSRHQ
uniref:Uncharacterized protein n=1 Tax=Anguilla anguilla TaxID=7936 RepID=A0A0E9RNB2_ANGAN